MVNDFTEMDFFRDARLVDDPYPYYESLRQQCPVTREDHHGVTMVTGWDEACAVLNDAQTFSSCVSVTGPFPGFPVPLEGDDITDLIEQHRDELPFSDQLPTLDPPTHTNHRALLMRLITPKRLKENEDAMWVLADQALDGFLAPGEGELIKGFAGPFTLLVIADLLGVPEEDRDQFVKNIHRHSGSKSAAIHVSFSEGNLSVEIKDHGKGMSVEKLSEIKTNASGVGIRGMRERVRQLGGRITIHSDKSGTTVSVSLPASPQASGKEGTRHSLESPKEELQI